MRLPDISAHFLIKMVGIGFFHRIRSAVHPRINHSGMQNAIDGGFAINASFRSIRQERLYRFPVLNALPRCFARRGMKAPHAHDPGRADDQRQGDHPMVAW
jgi:hypothetical protein